MIDEKKIEEAAEEASVTRSRKSYEDFYYQEGFKAGVNWFEENLWHDIRVEEPVDKSICLCYDKLYGEYRVLIYNKIFLKYWRDKIIKWLYIEDLTKGDDNG